MSPQRSTSRRRESRMWMVRLLGTPAVANSIAGRPSRAGSSFACPGSAVMVASGGTPCVCGHPGSHEEGERSSSVTRAHMRRARTLTVTLLTASRLQPRICGLSWSVAVRV
eukprot:4729183-Pyramimonas_sp.AAC.1